MRLRKRVAVIEGRIKALTESGIRRLDAIGKLNRKVNLLAEALGYEFKDRNEFPEITIQKKKGKK